MKLKSVLCMLGTLLLANPFCMNVAFATETTLAETTPNPCYISTIDYDSPLFNPDGNWMYRVNFENGDRLFLSESELDQPFLMMNGEFVFDTIVIQNGCAYIAPQDIAKYIGATAEISDDLIHVFDANISVEFPAPNYYPIKKIAAYEDFVGSLFTIHSLPVKAKVINGEVFVPLRYVAETFGVSVSYAKNIAPFSNPTVGLCDKGYYPAFAEAVYLATESFNQYYQNALDEANLKVDSRIPEGSILAADNTMQDAKFVGTLSSYWVIEVSENLLLVDMGLQGVYLKCGNGNAGHGSYSEQLIKLDIPER